MELANRLSDVLAAMDVVQCGITLASVPIRETSEAPLDIALREHREIIDERKFWSQIVRNPDLWQWITNDPIETVDHLRGRIFEGDCTAGYSRAMDHWHTNELSQSIERLWPEGFGWGGPRRKFTTDEPVAVTKTMWLNRKRRTFACWSPVADRRTRKTTRQNHKRRGSIKVLSQPPAIPLPVGELHYSGPGYGWWHFIGMVATVSQSALLAYGDEGWPQLRKEAACLHSDPIAHQVYHVTSWCELTLVAGIQAIEMLERSPGMCGVGIDDCSSPVAKLTVQDVLRFFSETWMPNVSLLRAGVQQELMRLNIAISPTGAEPVFDVTLKQLASYSDLSITNIRESLEGCARRKIGKAFYYTYDEVLPNLPGAKREWPVFSRLLKKKSKNS